MKNDINTNTTNTTSQIMSLKSNFQKVVNFNTQFGVLPSGSNDSTLVPKSNIIENDPRTVEFCLKLIREEARETEEAVKTRDFVEMVDGLIDLLYVTYGMLARVGINADVAFSLVHDNNMSKLCKSEDEAKKSVQYYKDTPSLGFDSPAYRLASDNFHWVVYNESTKKILKSVDYKPVDLTSVCK